MSARKGKNLKQVKYQLKALEEAFERDATARHKNISVRNALIIAQKCVDKQIGQKPTYEGDGYAPDGSFVWDEWLCPCCNSRYEVDYDDYDYCPNCGQKIDWEVENNGKAND